jgi:hypothetical protein
MVLSCLSLSLGITWFKQRSLRGRERARRHIVPGITTAGADIGGVRGSFGRALLFVIGQGLPQNNMCRSGHFN